MGDRPICPTTTRCMGGDRSHTPRPLSGADGRDQTSRPSSTGSSPNWRRLSRLTYLLNLNQIWYVRAWIQSETPNAPGAGTPPPALIGRDDLRSRARVAIERLRLGRSSKSLLLVGLRGVGKTVLLDDIRETAESTAETLRIEAPENRSLPSLLAPQLRLTLLRLSRSEKAKDIAHRGLKALSGFAKALKVIMPGDQWK